VDSKKENSRTIGDQASAERFRYYFFDMDSGTMNDRAAFRAVVHSLVDEKAGEADGIPGLGQAYRIE
jgi:hypothetical protein